MRAENISKPTTVADVLRAVRIPGRKLLMPVLVPGDVVYLVAEKSSVKEYLRSADPSAVCAWEVVRETEDAVWLDTQNV